MCFFFQRKHNLKGEIIDVPRNFENVVPGNVDLPGTLYMLYYVKLAPEIESVFILNAVMLINNYCCFQSQLINIFGDFNQNLDKQFSYSF